MADGQEGNAGAGGAASGDGQSAPDAAALQAEVERLRAHSATLLGDLTKAKQKVAAYDGVDLEEHKRLKKDAEERAAKKAADEGDWKALERQMAERHTEELQKREAKAQKLERALHERLVQAELRKAIGDKEGMPDMADLLLEYGQKFVRVKETEAGYEAYVVDAQGNARIADGVGTPLSIAGFVETELMAKYPRAFKGSGSSGSGAAKSTGGAGGVKTIAAGDQGAFLGNLADIAAGRVLVK